MLVDLLDTATNRCPAYESRDQAGRSTNSGFLSKLHIHTSGTSVSGDSASEPRPRGRSEWDTTVGWTTSPGSSAVEGPPHTRPMPASVSNATADVAQSAGSTSAKPPYRGPMQSLASCSTVQRTVLSPVRTAFSWIPRSQYLPAPKPSLPTTSRLAGKSLFTGTSFSATDAYEESSKASRWASDVDDAKASSSYSSDATESAWVGDIRRKQWHRSLWFRLAMGALVLAGVGVSLAFALKPETNPAAATVRSPARHPKPTGAPASSNMTALAAGLTTTATSRATAQKDPILNWTTPREAPAPSRMAPPAPPPTSTSSPVEVAPKANAFDFSDFAKTSKPFQGIAYTP
jgi:hypothetical protein